MGLDAPWHWVILALLVLLLFGYKRMPDAARSLGRSLRIFKTEIKGMSEDDAARAQHITPTPPAAPSATAEPSVPPVSSTPPVIPVTTPVTEPNHRTD